MAVAVTNIGNNPSTPGNVSEAYIPDQLIAGNLKIVTDTVTIASGSVVLPRGTVLGLAGLGAITSSAGKTAATGTILVAAVPTALDTVTIFGTAITFVAANPTGNQVLIGATAAATALNLLNFLLGSADANLIKANYSLSGATITATTHAFGTAGNSLTLATSNAVAFTVSGATLSGGTANTGAETIGSITGGPRQQAGDYTVVLTSATLANVFAPNGSMIGVATVGTAFVDPQINFTITTGAGIAAGDIFVLSSAPGSQSYTIATGSAIDGSQAPVAILADIADPTGGAVLAPVYLMGEFNVNAMTFGAGITINAAKIAMRPLGIYLKTALTAADPS